MRNYKRVLTDYNNELNQMKKTKTGKHTKRKWELLDMNPLSPVIYIMSESHNICDVHTNGNQKRLKEQRTNAELIAAAPETAEELDKQKELNKEMLEALKILLNKHCNTILGVDRNCWERIGELVTKAEKNLLPGV